jgi:rhodanese-related sulfurtransferase
MDAQIAFYEHKLNYEIDSWDLHEAQIVGENIIVIDAHSPNAFQAGHIPGAINLPHRQINDQSTAQFDRSALYVSYCDGIGCNTSTKCALALAKLGFRVKELMGGLDWWRRDGYVVELGEAAGDVLCGCDEF